MAMTAGSVVVALDGTATKSGMAEAIYDSFISGYSADTDCAIPDGAAGYAIKRGYAAVATRLATALVTYIAANAKAGVSGAVTGLQKSTAPAGTLTDPHGGATILLPIA